MIYRAKLLGAVVVKLSEHVAGYANVPEPLTEIDVGIISVDQHLLLSLLSGGSLQSLERLEQVVWN